ncbi:MAG: hypothetical protein IT434_06670 [Phycisphaerales bacterium]|jgi:hypothetical protein|nr:hypothetical protein [Phycisphaerales bacterium]
MRVLHLIAPPDPARVGPWAREEADRSDAAVRLCVEVINRESRVSEAKEKHAVILIGGSGVERRAGWLGLTTTDRVAPPAGIAALAWRGVRRLALARGPHDIVQPWSDDLVRLAHMIGMGRVCPPPSELVSTPTRRTRAETRTALGVHDDRPLVLMLADPPASIDVRQCCFLAGLFEVADWPGQVVVPARPTSRSRRLSAPMRLAHATLTDLPTPALVHACDLAALLPPSHGPVSPEHPAIAASVEMALRAGLPVIVPPGSPSADRMGAIDPALVALWNTGAAIATALGPLISDPAHRDALSRACAAAARPANFEFVTRAWRASSRVLSHT